jgi:hypothetical protein
VQGPAPADAQWREESRSDVGDVLVDTVARFKGLEAPATILWAIDDLTAAQHLELLYVGTSRAKSLLCLAGTPDACNSLVAADAR